MKFIATSFLVLTSGIASPSQAIEFWHSNTVWAGQGKCSAVFTFDSGMEEITNLQVAVSGFTKEGRQVISSTLTVHSIGVNSVERYAEAYLEGEEVCSDELTIVVTKATAVIQGKTLDLLKAKMITAKSYRPFKIRIEK